MTYKLVVPPYSNMCANSYLKDSSQRREFLVEGLKGFAENPQDYLFNPEANESKTRLRKHLVNGGVDQKGIQTLSNLLKNS